MSVNDPEFQSADQEITNDMTKATFDNLSEMVSRDGLTGLYNRRRLDKDLSELSGSDDYSITFLDVDDFKKFNDRFGHHIGDEVLIDVSRAAEFSSRAESDGVYRYGGEEIVIVRMGQLSRNTLLERTEELRKRIQRIEVRIEEKTAVTASLGLASKMSGDTPIDVLRRAETAMRIAKDMGKNQYKFLDRSKNE